MDKPLAQALARPLPDIVYEKPDGSSTSMTLSSVIASNDQYLYTAAPQWSLVSTSVTSAAGVVSVASSSITSTIVLKAKALGGSMTKPVVGDFLVNFASSTQSNGAYTAANSINNVTPTITVSPSTGSSVGEDAEYTVTIVGTMYSDNTQLGGSRTLFMAIRNITGTVGGNTIANQTWGIDTFYSSAAQLTKGTL